jgi:hypothetical protein
VTENEALDLIAESLNGINDGFEGLTSEKVMERGSIVNLNAPDGKIYFTVERHKSIVGNHIPGLPMPARKTSFFVYCLDQRTGEISSTDMLAGKSEYDINLLEAVERQVREGYSFSYTKVDKDTYICRDDTNKISRKVRSLDDVREFVQYIVENRLDLSGDVKTLGDEIDDDETVATKYDEAAFQKAWVTALYEAAKSSWEDRDQE